MPKRAVLIPLVKNYFEDDPEAAARSLEAMPEEDAVKVLKALPPIVSAKAFPHLQIDLAAALLTEVPAETFQQIVSNIDPQQGAVIMTHLPQEIREQMLEHLADKTKRMIRELLIYPADSAGRIMNTDVLSFRQHLTVKEATQRIRQLAKKGFPASYIYVVDKEDRLVGVINMRDLMLASKDATLDTVMRKEIFSVDCFMDRETIAQELSNRKFFAAPVVDSEKHLLGVVRAEQLIQQVSEEATEDIQKMFGAGGDERSFSPLPFVLKKRLPWLHVNLATAFLAAAVVALFENVIAQITVLAVFLPVVAGQGGNAGAQSLAVVMRGLVMREIPPHSVKPLIVKEILIGIINGLIIGAVTGLVAWLWKRNPFLGVVIGLGMIVNLTAAGLAGAGIPILMKKLGWDPAQSSSIILTTVTDVVGFFAFLGFAFLFRGLLI